MMTFLRFIIFAFIFVVFLSGCSRFLGLDEEQLEIWFYEKNLVIKKLHEKIKECNLINEINLNKITRRNVEGNLSKASCKKGLYDDLDDILNSLELGDRGVFVSRNAEGALLSVSYSFYTSGLCMAFSDCLETYVVYYSKFDHQLLKEKRFVYTKLNEDGWYILKVTAN